jgi:uncharacterized membrane protein HdeD (DUF308 family)
LDFVTKRVRRRVDRYVDRQPWLALALQGVAAVVIGILLLVDPARASVLVVALIALYFIIRGGIALFSLINNHHEWGWRLAGGILGVGVGVLMLASLLAGRPGFVVFTFSLLSWVVGGVAILYGIWYVVRGIAYRQWIKAVLGFLLMLLGFLLLVGLVLVVTSNLDSFVLGVAAIVAGVAAVFVALRKRAQPAPLPETITKQTSQSPPANKAK